MHISALGRRRITLFTAATMVVVLLWAGASWWTAAHRSALTKALDAVPSDAQRLTWTDWTKVRAALNEAASTSGPLSTAELVTAAYDADLSAASAFVGSAQELDTRGLPLDQVQWELVAQSRTGALTLLKVDDAEAWLERLEALGWNHDGDLWDGADLVAAEGLSPEWNYLTVRDGVLATSSDRDYLLTVTDSAGGPERGHLEPAMAKAADTLGHPVAAVVYSGDYACSHLAMSQSGEFDQQQAQLLLGRAGQTDPLTAFAFGYVDTARPITAKTRSMALTLGFESSELAEDNETARRVLATGDAPGQGGTFAERFSLSKLSQKGSQLQLELGAHPGQSVLSDLSSGPVLFATC